MADKKEMTAQTASVGADAGQSLTNNCTLIISDSLEKFNGEYDFPGIFPNPGDPHFLPAISMSTLFETAYQGKPPTIDGILYPGTYLFAGAPTLGKSFLMLQLGYHVSTGQPLWGLFCATGCSSIYSAFTATVFPACSGSMTTAFWSNCTSANR